MSFMTFILLNLQSLFKNRIRISRHLPLCIFPFVVKNFQLQAASTLAILAPFQLNTLNYFVDLDCVIMFIYFASLPTTYCLRKHSYHDAHQSIRF